MKLKLFSTLFILLLFSLCFTLFAGFASCAIDFIFGISIGYVVLGISVLVSASIFVLMILIVVISIIIDCIKCFIDDHSRR